MTCLLKLKVKDWSLCLFYYAPNAVNEYQAFVDDVSDVLQGVESIEFTIVLGDFNPHFGTYNEKWKGVIGWHGDQAFNKIGQLQLCCNTLCITNIFFEHTRCSKIHSTNKPSKVQKSWIDFCIVHPDLFSKVLGGQVK